MTAPAHFTPDELNDIQLSAERQRHWASVVGPKTVIRLIAQARRAIELESRVTELDVRAVRDLGLQPIPGVVTFLRTNWFNDGAEGEAVHKLCAYAEAVPKLLAHVEKLEAHIVRLGAMRGERDAAEAKAEQYYRRIAKLETQLAEYLGGDPIHVFVSEIERLEARLAEREGLERKIRSLMRERFGTLQLSSRPPWWVASWSVPSNYRAEDGHGGSCGPWMPNETVRGVTLEEVLLAVLRREEALSTALDEAEKASGA